MNVLEYEMIEVLRKLKEEHGVIEIKAEFESEGSRMVELMRLKDIADRVELPVILKIGGVEAVTDMYDALSLGALGIVAPMAETAFAASKFLNAVETFIPKDNQKDIEFAINIETITSYSHLDAILSLPNISVLDSITFGRVDFTGSLGLYRSEVNDQRILDYCVSTFERCRRTHRLRTALGGAISEASYEFVKGLVDRGLLDKYETRKVVYRADGIAHYHEGIREGIRFELLWLKSKRRYYHRITIEDEKRIAMLEERIAL